MAINRVQEPRPKVARIVSAAALAGATEGLAGIPGAKEADSRAACSLAKVIADFWLAEVFDVRQDASWR